MRRLPVEDLVAGHDHERPACRRAQEILPVLDPLQSGIELPHRFDHRAPEQGVGAGAQEEAEQHRGVHVAFVAHGWLGAERPAGGVDLAGPAIRHAGVRPPAQRLELEPELVRSPQVVGVETRKVRAARAGDPRLRAVEGPAPG